MTEMAAFGGLPFLLWRVFFRVTNGAACHMDGQLFNALLG